MLVRGLARPRPVLRHATLTACMTLAVRPLVTSQFSAKDISAYLINVLSVPGLVSHLQSTAPEVGDVMDVAVNVHIARYAGYCTIFRIQLWLGKLILTGI